MIYTYYFALTDIYFTIARAILLHTVLISSCIQSVDIRVTVVPFRILVTHLVSSTQLVIQVV